LCCINLGLQGHVLGIHDSLGHEVLDFLNFRFYLSNRYLDVLSFAMCVCVCVFYFPEQLTVFHFTDRVAVWVLIKTLERPKFVSVLECCSYVLAVVYNTKKIINFFIVRFQVSAKWMRSVFFWAIT
jgi:hypothetical protein